MSKNTVVNYQRDVNTFLKTTGNLKADEFEQAAARWLNERRDSLAPNSISRHLCSLKRFAEYNKLKLKTLNDYKLPKAAEPTPHPLPGGIDDVKKMIDVAETAEHEALVALCGLGGLRIFEALAMPPQWVNVHDMSLTVMGKGKKMRTVPMSPLLWETIAFSYAKAITSGDPATVLVPLQERAARRAVTALGKRAGIGREVASHDLRATFATAVHRKTKDVLLVKTLLGHSSVQTTQGYLGLDAEHLRQAVVL